jgi:RNA polymerase sigma factor (sigma-70 family)
VVVELNEIGVPAVADCDRERLVRLCAFLTGEHSVAEDLAQETLLQAWRSWGTLRDPECRDAWLSGIARNVCRHWLRGHERGVVSHDSAEAALRQSDQPAVDDLEIELERSELAELFDRAMALLPPVTRGVLLQRYLEDRSHADIAQRMQLKESTVKVKVHRGKVALRRVLAEHFPDDLAALGVSPVTDEGWEGTCIWCWQCGERRLQGRRSVSDYELWLRCPGCCREPHEYMTHTRYDAVPGLRWAGSYTAMLDRLFAPAEQYYRKAVVDGKVACPFCSGPALFSPAAQDDPRPYPSLGHFSGIRCETCGEGGESPLVTVTMCLREGQDFSRAHRRIRFVPDQELEYHGRAAVLTGLESVTGAGRLDAIYDRETYRLLAIEQTGA